MARAGIWAKRAGSGSAASTAAQDYFGNTVTSQRTNQIEVPFNDANWQDYVIIAPPQSPATATQANGEVLFQTGVGGIYSLQSRDVVRYRAGAEIGWGFTWRLDTFTAGHARIGVATDDNFTDGVYVERSNTGFYVAYHRNGATIQTWPLTLDPTVNQLFRIRAGLFGYAGFIVEALNGTWQKVAEFVGIGTDQPVFVDYDMGIHANVTGTDITLATGCWAGWTGVSLKRVSDAFTDRTLVQATQSVIVGKTTAGGGSYEAVKVNPSGALTVEADVINTVTVDTGLIQPTTPADTQPVSATSLPLPAGAATEAKQLPDNHQVQVSNFPSEYPLPAAQVTALTPQTDALTEAQLRTVVPDEAGVWSYYAGATGSVSVAGRVLQITATAGLVAGSLTINGGATISVPAGKSITIEPRANLSSPTVVFTGTQAYFIEVVA